MWAGSLYVYVNIFVFVCKWLYVHLSVLMCWMCQHMCVFISEYEWTWALYLCFYLFVFNECEKISMSEKMHEDVAIYWNASLNEYKSLCMWISEYANMFVGTMLMCVCEWMWACLCVTDLMCVHLCGSILCVHV